MIEWVIDGGYAKLGFEEINGKAYVHCQVYSINHEQFAEFTRHFRVFKRLMRKRGYKEIYSLISTKGTLLIPYSKTLEKFQVRFGMKEISRNGSLIEYRQKL